MKITLTIDEAEIKKAIELWLAERGLTKVLTVKVIPGNGYSVTTCIEVTLSEEGFTASLKETKNETKNIGVVEKRLSLDVG